jgi:putative hydrolase of the HAD superfamily
MPIKAAIWDVGGVIARTEDLSPRDQLAEELGVTRAYLNELFFSGHEGIRAQKGEITVDELMATIRGELGLAPAEHPDLETRFFAGDHVDEQLVNFIRAMKPGYKTGIISNAWSGLSDMLKRWKIRDAFDVVIGSGDVGVMKPDPRIYWLALDNLAVQPEEAVFLDDFIENVDGARAIGMHAIHFRGPEQAIQELNVLLKL